MNVKPYKTTLSEENAKWMAKIAKLVYLSKGDVKGNIPDDEKILKILCEEDDGFERVHPYDNKSSQAILIEHEDFICMAFRGTDQVEDWLDNIDIREKDALFGFFHEGFWVATQDIWPQIYNDYQHAHREKGRPLFLTGHSLGGAMATIAAAELIDKDIPFTSVYTFGQPRTMNRETGRKFNSECKNRFHRFCNDKDLVTRLPSRVGGFTHVGQVVYIDNELTLHQNIGRWHQFIDTLSGAVKVFKKEGLEAGFKQIGELIKDHNMENYIHAVEKWKLAKKD